MYSVPRNEKEERVERFLFFKNYVAQTVHITLFILKAFTCQMIRTTSTSLF